MPSLLELVDRVNKGESIDPQQLEVYQESANSAEKFLANHAQSMLDLRRAQQHILQALEAIDYSDQKVLTQFVSISGFLGLTDQRCAPLVKFGAMAIHRREYALGIEAIASAVASDLASNGSFTRDRQSLLFIASQYQRATQLIGWTPAHSRDWNNPQTRIALIISAIADDEPAARMIRGLARHLDNTRFTLSAYSTEANVRRDKQQFALITHAPLSSKRGVRTLQLLSQQKIKTYLAPTDADTVSAARGLAVQLVKDRIDIAIIDATQADPIASLITHWDIAPIKVNLCRRSPLFSSGIDCITYLDQARYETDHASWRRQHLDTTYLLEGIDLVENQDLGPAPQRSQYGIPRQAIVLATASADLDKTLSEEFIETIVTILRQHPNAIYLAIGEGDLSGQKRKIESAGIAKRVGYCGKRRDMPGFLRLADIYLAEFPTSGATGVLQAMSLARPIVAMKWSDDAAGSQAAAIIGNEHSISLRNTKGYIERAGRFIREPALRQRIGGEMLQRIEDHFSMSQTARHLEQLCEQLMHRRDANLEAKTILRDDDDNNRDQNQHAAVA